MRSFISDLIAVLSALPVVEFGRLRRGPRGLLQDLRARGMRGRTRSSRERRLLGRIIKAVDICFPGGGNCYRRALLETAVDPTAAATPLKLGLRSGGGSRSGHAWLGSNSHSETRYDAEFSL